MRVAKLAEDGGLPRGIVTSSDFLILLRQAVVRHLIPGVKPHRRFQLSDGLAGAMQGPQSLPCRDVGIHQVGTEPQCVKAMLECIFGL
jgi:hypothetical protein